MSGAIELKSALQCRRSDWQLQLTRINNDIGHHGERKQGRVGGLEKDRLSVQSDMEVINPQRLMERLRYHRQLVASFCTPNGHCGQSGDVT